jgi:hypothetical protein
MYVCDSHNYARYYYNSVCLTTLVLLIISVSNKVFTAVLMTVLLCKLSFAQ